MNTSRIPLRYTLTRDGEQLKLNVKIADGVNRALHDRDRDLSSFAGLMDGKHYPVTVERSASNRISFLPNYLTLFAGSIMSETDLSASLEMPADEIESFEANVRSALDLFNESYRQYGY